VGKRESAELPSELVDDAYNIYLGVLAVTVLLQDYHHTHGHRAQWTFSFGTVRWSKPASCCHAKRLWHDGARLLVSGQLPIVHGCEPRSADGGRSASAIIGGCGACGVVACGGAACRDPICGPCRGRGAGSAGKGSAGTLGGGGRSPRRSMSMPTRPCITTTPARPSASSIWRPTWAAAASSTPSPPGRW
jgi:hypothetical protein